MSSKLNNISISILGTRGIPARYGGFETFAEHLAVGLVKKGHFVNVYCPKYQSYKENSYKGVSLIYITNYEYIFEHRIPRAICNLVYDIFCLFHACISKETKQIYMLGYSAGPFLIMPKMFGKKIIINPDGLEWKSTRWGYLARKWLLLCEFISAKYSNQLIGDAQPITDRFIKMYNAPIITIEYGTELYVKEDGELEYKEQSYYLAVARMVPETKLDLIIKGFINAKIECKKLLIVGPITDQQFFNMKILPHIGRNNVEYLGAIYDNLRLKKLRAHSMALIHGHASDGTNPSLLESMGCASPVISIDRESNATVLTRENVFYFDDAQNLSDVLKSFEKLSEDEREAMGKKNYLRVKNNYSWDAAVRAHENVFIQLALNSERTK